MVNQDASGELIFYVMDWLAQSKSALSQRMRAGMDRAKAKHMARPPLAQVKQEAIAQNLGQCRSMN